MPEADGEDDEAPPQPVLPLADEELEVRRAHFDGIFEGSDAISLKEKSRAERKEMEKEDLKSLSYAELDMACLHQILNKVKADHGPLYAGKGVFLDLGSGAGKACIAAALLHPFQRVVGIETVQSLHGVALSAAEKYQELQLPEALPKPELEFIQGDFVTEFEGKLEGLLSDVVLCLALSTCYGDAELKAMATVASKMPDDAIFITFSQGLPESLIIDLGRNPAQRRAVAVKRALARRGVEPSTVEVQVDPPVNDPFGWTLLHSEEMQMAWGPATCFIYKKLVVEGLRPEPPSEEAQQED